MAPSRPAMKIPELLVFARSLVVGLAASLLAFARNALRRVRTESSGVDRLAPIRGLFPRCTSASEQGAFAPRALPGFVTGMLPPAVHSGRLHPSLGRR